MSIVAPDPLDPLFDFPLPLLFPLPLPFGYLLGPSSWSDCCLLSGLEAALGADFAGIGMRYGINSGEVRSVLISLSKGVTATPGSACKDPTRALDARMNICLSHSMICCKVTEAKPDG